MDHTNIPIAEVMTKRPVSVKTGDAVDTAAQMMLKYQVSSVLVMNKKELLGVITSDDITYKVVAEKKDPLAIKVDEIMATSLITIDPMSSLQDAMRKLSENDIRQLPVISKGVLAGLITIKDVIRHEPTLVDMMVENIRFEEQQRQEEIKRYSEGAVDESLFR
ncbi:MAG: CBS domain-containing protein [Nanoarchaeota archaeon]|nr:CBS domain-containing protein [Nanoarchaeota archaeon]